MLDATVLWDGKAKEFMGSLAGQVLEAQAEEFAARVSGIHCPRHGSAPKVRIRGDSEQSLTLVLVSCCDTLAKMVTAETGAR